MPTPDEIQTLRLKHGLLQTQLAEALSVSRRAVQTWEEGQAAMPPGLWELFQLKAGEIPLSPLPQAATPSPRQRRKP